MALQVDQLVDLLPCVQWATYPRTPAPGQHVLVVTATSKLSRSALLLVDFPEGAALAVAWDQDDGERVVLYGRAVTSDLPGWLQSAIQNAAQDAKG